MACNFGKWQPIGDQFPWACRVCVNKDSTKCLDCRCEKTSGFEFEPHQYVKLCQKFGEEKYFFDGEKYWLVGGQRGGGKIFHLEQMLAKKDEQLKFWKEDRDYWKQIAQSMIQRVVELSQMYIDKE